MKKVFVFLFLFQVANLFVAPVMADDAENVGVEPAMTVEWRALFQGIDAAENTSTVPRKQKIFVVRIDTQEPGISFFSTPKRAEDFDPEKNETVRQTTNAFLKEYQLQLAVNANFFAIPKGESYYTPGSSDLLGTAISDGVVVSKPLSAYPSFCIGKKGKPVITDSLDLQDDSLDISTAVAGNTIILKDGKIDEQKNQDTHPRTAVGISQDERYVYFLVIDGRQKGYSEGTTYKETAFWLRYYGAWHGLNLDGGGSTTLVMQDKKGQPRIVNRPSGRRPRINGNSIGVRAQLLP